MKIIIYQLPYNIENFHQIVDNLRSFSGQIIFLDNQKKIGNLAKYDLPCNCTFEVYDNEDIVELSEICRRNSIDNVVSFAELGLLTAARLREINGMMGHTLEIELNTVDKHRMRIALQNRGLSNIVSNRISPERLSKELNEACLPAVVKPADLTGSIGVQLITSRNEIPKYIERINDNVYSKGHDLVIESYIHGDEYSVEGLLLSGQIFIYGITEKYTSGPPYFVESGHSFFSEHELEDVLQAQLPTIFDALNMSICPFHIEFKVTDGKIEIIEIHSRFGGGFITKLIELATGNKLFLDYVRYLDEGILPFVDRKNKLITSIQFVLCEKGRVSFVNLLPEENLDWLVDYKCDCKIGDIITPSTGYFDRPSYYIYQSETRELEKKRREYLSLKRIEIVDDGINYASL